MEKTRVGLKKKLKNQTLKLGPTTNRKTNFQKTPSLKCSTYKTDLNITLKILMQKLDFSEPSFSRSNIFSTEMVQTMQPVGHNTCYQHLSSHDCMERATKLKHNLIKIKNTSYASVMTNPCKDQETPKSVNPVKGG